MAHVQKYQHVETEGPRLSAIEARLNAIEGRQSKIETFYLSLDHRLEQIQNMAISNTDSLSKIYDILTKQQTKGAP